MIPAPELYDLILRALRAHFLRPNRTGRCMFGNFHLKRGLCKPCAIKREIDREREAKDRAKAAQAEAKALAELERALRDI